MRLRFLMVAIIALITTISFAQEKKVIFATATPSVTLTPTAPPTEIGYIEPQVVIVRAADQAILVGDFYLVDPLRPTVILLHQLYTTRQSWEFLISPLIGAHYNVLAVDLRGYGESSSSIDWRKAVTDVQLWFDWLRTEGGVRPDAISTIGSSMGSSMAIVGCANDPLCKTTIAISPGWDYFGIFIEDALAIGLQNRSMLVLYAERDRWPAIGMPLIEEAATGILSIEMFPANQHGIDLIKQHEVEAITMILDWLLLYGE